MSGTSLDIARNVPMVLLFHMIKHQELEHRIARLVLKVNSSNAKVLVLFLCAAKAYLWGQKVTERISTIINE